jgi:hypothetical protein
VTGIYLQCDICKATLGGEQVTANPDPPPGWFNQGILRDAARKLGWTGPLNSDSDSDRCPECSRAAVPASHD